MGSEPEHASAKRDRGNHVPARFFDVLDAVGEAGSLELVTGRANEERSAYRARRVTHGAVALAGWGGPHEGRAVERMGQSVATMESERVTGLALNIDAGDFEPGTPQADASAASAAKEVEGKRRLAHAEAHARL